MAKKTKTVTLKMPQTTYIEILQWLVDSAEMAMSLNEVKKFETLRKSIEKVKEEDL